MTIFFQGGCGSQTEDPLRSDGGGVSHLVRADMEPTRAKTPIPLQWAEVSQDEIYRDLAVAWDHPDYLGSESPETRRLQFWIDELYNELVAQDRDRFQFKKENTVWRIPHPQVRIMVHDTPNAFASTRTVCYRSSLALAKAQGRSQEGVPATMLINKKGTIGLYPPDQIVCLDRSDEAVPASWIADYLEANVGVDGCTYRLEGKTLVFDASCTVGGLVPDRAVDRIALRSVTPWITVTTGMLRLVSQEDQLVFILAHELAHYFHAHGALVKDNFHFFYRQNDANLRRARPMPEPSLSELGQSLRKLPAYRTQPIEGQKFHSEMFSYFRTAWQHIVIPVCQDKTSPCFNSCREIISLAGRAEFQKNLLKFPQTTLHGEALAQYFQYEENYLKCSEDVILASETDPSKGQIGVDVVKRIYWKARLQPLPAALTLASVIFDMNAQLIAEEMERTSLLQKALDEDLGFYTTEQEADFLALQWVALLGLDPGAAREFWLEYLQAAPEQDSPYNFGYERCDAAYHQSPRWTQSGQRLGVPYGSFAQIHPGKCHRVYQIDKRLGAVSFTVGRRRSPLNEVL